MVKSRKPLLAVIVLSLMAAGTLVAASEAPAKAPAIQKVEAKRVCMVNNEVFDRDMIPVEYDGKTYFGCCNMCKRTLAENADARTAVDPISGKPVDKASAIFGALPDNSVLYFESEQTFEEWVKKNG